MKYVLSLWKGLIPLPARRETRTQIAARIAAEERIGLREMRGSSACRYVAWPRQCAFYEMREAGYTYPQIARFFRRDHTTCCYGVRAHAKRLVGALQA